jgi:PAS domain S-box-containing protein
MIPASSASPTPPAGQRRAEALAEAHQQAVELMAKDAPLEAVLDGLCRTAEEQLPDAVCSVLLLEPDGQRVRDGAGPSLPSAFRRAVDGHPVGPAAGSCGTAIYRRETVITEDIASDPRWAGYRDAALAAGLAASASTPILGGGGQALGSFAIYHRHAGPFAAEELDILRDMNHLAALAITREQRMAALRERMAQLDMAQRLAHLGFWTWHMRDNRVDWSDGLYEIYGLDRASFGASFEGYLERVHPGDRAKVQAAVGQAVASKGAFAFEERIIRPDGTVRWLRSWGTVAADGNGQPERMMGTCLDITDLRASEEGLRQAQKQESLAVLAGGIAHDFNNLLTAILGNLELASAALPPGTPAAPYLERMAIGVSRASDLARQMLAYSGRGRVQVRAVDLNGLITDMAQLITATLPKKARLALSLDPALAPVEADAAQLQQVVMNLVINAVESLEGGEGLITLRTRHLDPGARDPGLLFPGGPPAPGPCAVLEAEDTGSGMPPEVLARIFDPFFTTKPTGRGLGLSAMLGILRGHHGGIKVESEPGRGTRFTLLFRETEPAEAAAAGPRGPGFEPGGLVLIVDDEAEIRTAAAAMMERLGFRCLTAADGAEAVGLVRARGRDLRLVLLDLSMPRLDGREAFDAIRALAPGLRVILTSGFDVQESALGIVGQGLAGFLQKPYTFDQLCQAVAAALA